MAGRIFVELVRELKAQGLGNKVIADMFGLTLRTYHDRVGRTSESVTDRGSSLWEAVLRHVRERQMLSRAELLTRFRADDEASVRGVLSDLVYATDQCVIPYGDELGWKAALFDHFQAVVTAIASKVTRAAARAAARQSAARASRACVACAAAPARTT